MCGSQPWLVVFKAFNNEGKDYDCGFVSEDWMDIYTL